MSRLYKISVLCFLSLLATGCREPQKEQPIKEQIKIGDLAPPRNETASGPGLLKTINFDIHVFEIPADKTSNLDSIWALLNSQPLLFTNYLAFTDNLFRAGFGRIEIFGRIRERLLQAGGQKITTISLLLPDGQANDLPVTTLTSSYTISFASSKSEREKITLGPGVLALRLKAQRIPPATNVCRLIGHPVFTVLMPSTIPQLMERDKAREFIFDGAAFGTKISPGELLVLGPANYTSDQSTLGGMFFNKPQGNLFFNTTQHKPAELKPAVKLFVLVCTGFNG